MRQRLLIKELKKLLPENGGVLDAGCGNGRLTRLMKKSGYKVFSFDESMECLKQGLESGNLKDNLWKGKTDKIPFRNESFDAVIAGDVLEHLQDDKGAVCEFFRVLKPEGVVIVSVPAHPEIWSIDDEWSGHKRRYKKETLERIFLRTGFEKIKIYHWGWPIVWIYYRLYYIHIIERRLGARENRSGVSGLKDSAFLRFFFWLLLLPDRLFLWSDLGIGLIGLFKKVNGWTNRVNKI